ncbi:MAG: DUF2939 domain-containing protein [Candidatus Brevundimonas colombiensis]|uniref:DUF2939 domain-containing protein n=1 Tax=Candidatus Brevundimonas colombiensis TaxID=3121376 RepID=A0AAJ5WYT5_9CAUL|nr:DUF2939 domain-containing protein [Brevundimonas sp.]WEK40871.1 MAG: DUF2939 domain-containing protein [Brevundimonas sp.]
MTRKIIIGAVIVGIVALAVALFASPFLTAQNIVRAARAGDAAALERQVDFPAFRASLKSELNARARLEIRERAKGDRGLAALGMLLAPSLVEGAVDNFVTPQGVAAMVRSGETPKPERPTPADDTPAAPKDKLHQSWAYRGLNRFAVTLTRDDRPNDELVLILERRGPFSWKLAGVDLTPDPMM